MEIEAIWGKFHVQLRTFILRRIRHSFDADDLVQDIFVKIANQLPSLQNHQKLHAWIYRIARNTLIDYYRERAGKQYAELPAEISQEEQSNDLNFNDEISRCLHELIDQLPEKYRQAIRLTEWSGYSQKQLGDMLGLSFSGAKSRVQRGRRMLKEMLIDCCRLELDRFGNVLDFEPRRRDATSENCEGASCHCC